MKERQEENKHGLNKMMTIPTHQCRHIEQNFFFFFFFFYLVAYVMGEELEMERISIPFFNP